MSDKRKQYPFDQFEPKWQTFWDAERTYRTPNPGEPGFDTSKPKYYVLDMFPYPSGAGLHVGHPEGYTATDIIARFKRMCGFNVLHPMGWDAFGLPAEQYAIKTGQHPRVTTEQNIGRFREQLKQIGFSYDWDREVNTTDPDYFKWTQWIFLKLYNSYFDPVLKKAQPIAFLEDALSIQPHHRDAWENNGYLLAVHQGYQTMDENRRTNERANLIERLRLAYVSEAPVNWCPSLGTVLANEEVVDGKSEVGGFPVERRPMRQWMLRIKEYAQRLIDDLGGLDWPESIKQLQRNWIGRSEGAVLNFAVEGSDENFLVYTTRPDTLFGATYAVLAPEHFSIDIITTEEQQPAVLEYREKTARKSDLDRTELAKEKTGVFTGAYAINPVNGARIPIWIADYVLPGYGTGAIMAVPAHDERDFEFAQQYKLPIIPVVRPEYGDSFMLELPGDGPHPLPENELEERYIKKPELYFGRVLPFVQPGIALNSANDEVTLNGLPTHEAKMKITAWLEKCDLGQKEINFKLRDWLFSRQRYWGEPFPVVWENGQHRALAESELPVTPPEMEDFKPTGTPEPPLSKAKDWLRYSETAMRETNTMPQWAGSCWYYLRYIDPKNHDRFVGGEAERYWMTGSQLSTLSSQPSNPGGVDLYVGGTEHAVLHLLYARFWHKALFDLGFVSTPEPFQRLVNQGIILGEDGQKMSKSRGNVVNPDDVIDEYGADAFRLYEMFMGPLEQTKPWSMTGVEGVYRFLARVWRLVMEEQQDGSWSLSPAVQEIEPDKAQLKVIHATIKKVGEDIESLSFNTAIAQMMIFVNAFTNANPRPKQAIRTLLLLLNPFAPHLTEELWSILDSAEEPNQESKIKNQKSLLASAQPWPVFDPQYLIEDEVEIVLQVNGKLRDKIVVIKDASNAVIEAAALASPRIQEFTAGKTVRKVVVVPGKLVNIVVG